MNLDNAAEWEQMHVSGVYSKLASSFSKSNQNIWPKVLEFIQSLPKDSLVIDVGCGKGRNLQVCKNAFIIGVDNCPELLDIGKQENEEREFCLADNLRLPFRSNVFDAVLSVGVIHHFATAERRQKALEELNRVLRSHGRLLVYVWAFEQKRKFTAQDILVPWKDKSIDQSEPTKPDLKIRKPATKPACAAETIKTGEIQSPLLRRFRGWISFDNWRQNSASSIGSMAPAPNTSDTPKLAQAAASATPPNSSSILARYSFVTNTLAQVSPKLSKRFSKWLWPEQVLANYAENLADSLIQAALREIDMIKTTDEARSIDLIGKNYRYYHLFKEKELETLVSKLQDVRILESYYDHANWCIVVEKV